MVKPKYDCDPGSLLDMLAEEASEVIKELIKARRFGMQGIPEWLKQGGKSPRDNIVQEIGDFVCIVDALILSGFVTAIEIRSASMHKYKRLVELFGQERVDALMREQP